MLKLILPLSRWVGIFLTLFLAGCAVHQDPSQFPLNNLKKVPSQSVAVRQGSIEYYRFGSGSPIILIPGYATDVSSWDSAFLASLAAHHQLIVLNNRNVGRSVVHSSQYDTEDLASDVYQLMQHLDLHKPAILGISMGGMIAQQLAVMHSDAIGQLILINTAIAGKEAIPPTPAVQKKMLELPTNMLQKYMVAVELFFPDTTRMQMAYTLAVERFQPDNYQAIDSAAIMPQQRQLIMHWVKDNATANKIRHLDLPVLILNGAADDVIPPVNSVILARNIQSSQLIRWKNGGHAMIYQYPVEIAAAIDEFIAINS